VPDFSHLKALSVYGAENIPFADLDFYKLLIKRTIFFMGKYNCLNGAWAIVYAPLVGASLQLVPLNIPARGVFTYIAVLPLLCHDF
jgi:hypothetical protein